MPFYCTAYRLISPLLPVGGSPSLRAKRVGRGKCWMGHKSKCTSSADTPRRFCTTESATARTTVPCATAATTSGAPIHTARAISPPRHAPGISPVTWLRGLACGSFHDFMLAVRMAHGDVVRINLWPVLPPIYLMMGKEANRGVLSELDQSLEQVLQDLINFLPVSANIPSKVDVELQKKTASLFQNVSTVNERLPFFLKIAEQIRDTWIARRGDPLATHTEENDRPLNVFFELSEFVLRADLEILFGPSFCAKYADRILPEFQQWVGELGELGATPVGFFTQLGKYLREALRERQADPEQFLGERSVMQIYLQEGALDVHDEAEVVGLLTMTLMAAVFNTQVSLAWILAHLYAEPELLATARAELLTCADLSQYSNLVQLPFVNSCIDEAVRLHTMLPGNTVLRRATEEVTFDGVAIPKGSLLWLYPNAVHRDEKYFPRATSFCPYRMLKEGWGLGDSAPLAVDGRLEPVAGAGGVVGAVPGSCPVLSARATTTTESDIFVAAATPTGGPTASAAAAVETPLRRMSNEYELVTFGHGTKRCIGEKMARAMICAFLGTVLPAVDAAVPKDGLPRDDNLFDLVPASKLELRNLRPHRNIEIDRNVHTG